MIDAARLLSDLKRVLRTLETDLRQSHATGPALDAVRMEWKGATDSGRTRETFEIFFEAALDQAGVHWVLACVFIRFLEDNGLIETPVIGGPGDRLELARERHAVYFRARPHDSDLDWLLASFREAAKLPGMSGLFDVTHNPLFRLPVSGDGAIRLREFFQALVPETGAPLHDFTDPDWDTRFLGDLYQDLSEEARKRYALLQTPMFIESWILDRTLEPAIREFGFRAVRMIDPTCGSGHFLLGGFSRVLLEWQRHEPGMAPPAQAQRALDAVAGVDINPFAVEIARFRLLLAALRAAGVQRLRDAPDFRMNLGTGDSLLHGRHFERNELGGAAEGFGRLLRHHYVTEDTAELDRILGRQYHAVVGNPPYITPKDPALRDAYREIFLSCHMKYGLGVPFIERFFDLAQAGTANAAAGFVGMIVANNFIKREFGAKLIEEVLPRLDLSHVIDTSSTYIPGHTTPTVILFGRNRSPTSATIRTVRVTTGAPDIPEVPSEGPVWIAILAQTDVLGSTSKYISVEDTSRETLARHPWSLGGGGAAEVQVAIEEDRPLLGSIASEVGITSVNGEDDAFTFSDWHSAKRLGIQRLQALVGGDVVRDYRIAAPIWALWPHGPDFGVLPLSEMPDVARHLWSVRTFISKRKRFGTPMLERGLSWYEFQELYPSKLRTPLTITFGEIATHNHFVLDRGGKVFNRTAPVIKLPAEKTENDYLDLLGLLNSSVACFWMKQVMMNKGGGGIGGGLKSEYWDRGFVFNSTNVERFPLAHEFPRDLARDLDNEARSVSANLPEAVCGRSVPTRDGLDAGRATAEAARCVSISLQEELDWNCYRLYGLVEDTPVHAAPPPLRLGQRAFEIVMARRMSGGTLKTNWFTRHDSTPIIAVPASWPADYRDVVERRIALIEADPTISLIERPEYKRRWAMKPWEEMEQDALRNWLLERLEDPSLWLTPAELLTTNQVTDRIRHDSDFMLVARLYRGREDFDQEALVAELVSQESVPSLAALRYSETGLRKRTQWKSTWVLQRQEDEIDAEVVATRPALLPKAESKVRERWCALNSRRDSETPDHYMERAAMAIPRAEVDEEADSMIAAEQRRRKMEEIGKIPVPPKYISKDFQSQDFWRLRGGLDVPKERFISFPYCSPEADGSLLVTWAGHNHLARAMAIGTFYQARKDHDGWPAERLVPLLAGLQELLPWLLQWHNGANEGRMGDYFGEFIRDEARAIGLTEEAVAAWTPPARILRARRRASA